MDPDTGQAPWTHGLIPDISPNLKCIAGMNILGSRQNFCIGSIGCRVQDMVWGRQVKACGVRVTPVGKSKWKPLKLSSPSCPCQMKTSKSALCPKGMAEISTILKNIKDASPDCPLRNQTDAGEGQQILHQV